MNVDGKCKLDVAGFVLVHAGRVHGITQHFHLAVRHVQWKPAQLQRFRTQIQ